jgi:protein-disulfide isomerase
MDDGKLPGKFALLLTLAAVAVIGIFALTVSSGPKELPRIANYDLENTSANLTAPTIFPFDPQLGPVNATNTIIEFGDYECAACATAAPELTALVSQRDDTRLVWKDYPLSGHANAEPAAEAARCAGDQGKFWQFHDALFAKQDSLGADLYVSIAADLKLDASAFSSCLKNGSHQNEISSDADAGDAALIDSLPYLFINGAPYAGGITAQEISAFLIK